MDLLSHRVGYNYTNDSSPLGDDNNLNFSMIICLLVYSLIVICCCFVNINRDPPIPDPRHELTDSLISEVI
jgi:hypothetical protein